MNIKQEKGLSEYRIQQWPIEKLRPYVKNPRRNDAAVERMAEILDEYGFRYPILVRSSGEIIDGHLRLKAAILRGYETVPVLLTDDMTDEQVRAFRVAVNKSATFAEWDTRGLLEELASVDLPTGFDDAEILNLFSSNATGRGESSCRYGNAWGEWVFIQFTISKF